MNDPPLVRVVNARAGLLEESQSLTGAESLLVAVLVDRYTRHVLHDEEGLATRCGPGIEDLGDRRVIHHRQGLTFGLEPRHDLPRVHAVPDHLEGDVAFHGLGLPGEPDLSHAALAQLAQQTVGADHDLLSRLTGFRRGLAQDEGACLA